MVGTWVSKTCTTPMYFRLSPTRHPSCENVMNFIGLYHTTSFLRSSDTRAPQGSTTGHEHEEPEPGEVDLEGEGKDNQVLTLDEVETVHKRHTHNNELVDAAQQGRSTWDRGTTLLRTIPSLSTHERPCTPDFGPGTSAPNHHLAMR